MIWEILWGFEPALITGFVIAGLILNLTPGADFLFITSSGLSGGPRMGVAAALGVNLGIVVHLLAAAAGLSALLLAHPATADRPKTARRGSAAGLRSGTRVRAARAEAHQQLCRRRDVPDRPSP